MDMPVLGRMVREGATFYAILGSMMYLNHHCSPNRQTENPRLFFLASAALC